jgi:hypothetical protein
MIKKQVCIILIFLGFIIPAVPAGRTTANNPVIGEVSLQTKNRDEIVAISSFLENNRGETFLFSSRQGKVFKFKPDGTFEKSFCRKGPGPGEIQRVLRMFHNPANDFFYLPEYYSGTGKVTIYDSRGNYQGLLKVDLPQTKMNKIAKFIFLEDGTFFLATSDRVAWKPEGKFFITQVEYRLGYYNKKGELLAEIFSRLLDDELSNAVRWGGPRILFRPSLLVKRTPGNQIAVAMNDDSKISIYNRKGKLVNTITLNLERKKLTRQPFEKAKANAVERLKRRGKDRMLYLMKNMIKLEYRPIYSNLFFHKDHIILLKPAERDDYGYVLKCKLMFFNKKGEKETEYLLPGWVRDLRQGKLYIISWDSSGSEYFKIVPVPLKNEG